VVLAGKGYAGVGEHVRILYRGRGKPASQKDANRAHAQLRSRRVGQCPAQVGPSITCIGTNNYVGPARLSGRCCHIVTYLTFGGCGLLWGATRRRSQAWAGGQPDQRIHKRIHTRRLTHRRLAGHQPNRISRGRAPSTQHSRPRSKGLVIAVNARIPSRFKLPRRSPLDFGPGGSGC
jgi:hypothetical protein